MKLKLILLFMMTLSFLATAVEVDQKIKLRGGIEYLITTSNELVFYIYVYGTKEEIFTKLTEWANLKFTKNKDSYIIIKENKDGGYLMINGNQWMMYGIYSVESVFKLIINEPLAKIKIY